MLPVRVPALCEPYSRGRRALALGARPRCVSPPLLEQLVQLRVEVLERGVLGLQQVSPGVGRGGWAEGVGRAGWAAGWAAAASGHGARVLLSGAEGCPEQAGEHPTRWVAARAPSCERGHLLPGGTHPRAPPSHGASRPAPLACRLGLPPSAPCCRAAPRAARRACGAAAARAARRARRVAAPSPRAARCPPPPRRADAPCCSRATAPRATALPRAGSLAGARPPSARRPADPCG